MQIRKTLVALALGVATLVGTAVPATAQTRRPVPLAPVPHVVGMYLDKAEAAMDWHHFTVTVFGGGLFGIVAPADWQVSTSSARAPTTWTSRSRTGRAPNS